MNNTLFDNFIRQYLRELDYYREAARICAQKCEVELEQNGIRAIVTYRVKRSDRLRSKIEARQPRKNYQSFEDISSDIFDLAGVRIALYFPGDRTEADRIIKSIFRVIKVKDFQTRNENFNDLTTSWGYRATHYRIQMSKQSLADSQLKYLNANIEIQVASVLMHAWAEIEHDLVYKPTNYQPSGDEIETLDEFNNIVLLGEKVLNRLQSSMQARIASEIFQNHYELAGYLFSKMNKAGSARELLMGRADILYNFLVKIGKNTPAFIKKQLSDIDPQAALVQQIADKILFGDSEFYRIYLSTKEKTGTRTPYDYAYNSAPEAIESEQIWNFLESWIKFEQITAEQHGSQFPLSSPTALDQLRTRIGLDEKSFTKLVYATSIRDEIIHGLEMPSTSVIARASDMLAEISAWFQSGLKGGNQSDPGNNET